jgi:hypothetical protein
VSVALLWLFGANRADCYAVAPLPAKSSQTIQNTSVQTEHSEFMMNTALDYHSRFPFA